MTSPIVRRPRSEEDLVEIWLYIAADNEPAADRFLQRLEQTFLMLAENPFAGRARPELLPDIRSFPVGSYVVFYKSRSNGIELVRVLSGYRDTLNEGLGEPP